nr:cation diffusion facilitator family transporter [Candidatus Poribacteria bacterium]
RLLAAVSVNVLLTLAQVIGGVISGSLSLIADALHNFSDAASLGIALFARKISRKPPDEFKTFGYKRAEIVAALINLTLLVVISLYLIYEAAWRLLEPQTITAWIVIFVATVALIVDIFTALITYSMSKGSMNMKAAFLHNLSDALVSVGVIISGGLILLYSWYWVDTLLTFAIAGFVLWQGLLMLPRTIHLLMEGTPVNLSIETIKKRLETEDGVQNVHHIHLWHLDESRIALEAHVVVTAQNLEDVEILKVILKKMLRENFSISHSTLEFEAPTGGSCAETSA